MTDPLRTGQVPWSTITISPESLGNRDAAGPHNAHIVVYEEKNITFVFLLPTTPSPPELHPALSFSS